MSKRSRSARLRLIADGEKLAKMPKKKYIVTLTDEEQANLKELVNKGKNPAYKVNHARILLLAEALESSRNNFGFLADESPRASKRKISDEV